MSSTPVFDQVFQTSNPFTVMPAEYTDRFTPEIARQQGFTAGYLQAVEDIKKIVKTTKPTKALERLVSEIEVLTDERF